MKVLSRWTATGAAGALLAAGLVAVGVPSAHADVTVTTPYGGGATGDGPMGIAVDASGNVYTANLAGDSVTKIAPGAAPAQWGTATGGGPRGIVVDGGGNVYTANFTGDSVTKIAPDGTTTQSFAATGPGPFAIATDGSGHLYTANLTDGTVSKIAPDGAVTQPWATLPAGSNPMGIGVDSAGNVYTANSGSNTVSKITPAGAVSQCGTTGGVPMGLAVDGEGNVFTANYGGDTITKISAGCGTTTEAWATTGTQGSGPGSIAVDSGGNVFAANVFRSTVTRVTPDGTATQAWATLPAQSQPQGIAIDADGNVFTANYVADNVSKITPPLGTVTVGSGAFGDVKVGATGTATVTATNSGEAPVKPTEITATGAGVSVSGGTCAVGTRIPSGRTCTVEVSWKPTAAGALSGASVTLKYVGGPAAGVSGDLTGTASGSPTPPPNPTTTLTVFSHKGPVKAGQKTVLTRKQRTDGEIKKVQARCELRGNPLPKRESARLCDLKVKRPLTAAVTGVRITAAPTCSKGLRIYATIVAKKAGAKRAVWNKAWRVTADPAIRCKISGTG